MFNPKPKSQKIEDKKPKNRGPTDVLFTTNLETVAQNWKGKQTTIEADDPYK